MRTVLCFHSISSKFPHDVQIDYCLQNCVKQKKNKTSGSETMSLLLVYYILLYLRLLRVVSKRVTTGGNETTGGETSVGGYLVKRVFNKTRQLHAI